MLSIGRAIDKRRVGFLVNPIAGLGGRAALRGSDDPEIRRLTAGRPAPAPERAAAALDAIRSLREGVRLLVPGGAMGADVAVAAGWQAEIVCPIAGVTTAADTQRALAAMVAARAELILFAGGDGTAVDVLEAVGTRVPVVGIPSGVKMHSAVFAVSPAAAGRLVSGWLHAARGKVAEREVMDVDEALLAGGVIAPRLHGQVLVPVGERLVQSPKARSDPGEEASLRGLAAEFRAALEPGCVYLVGPGTTTAAILNALGFAGSLLGVDVVSAEAGLEVADADDRGLLEAVAGRSVRIVLSPVGGQGFLFGRGNQQLAPEEIGASGRMGLLILATEAKLEALGGRPLLVDTGDLELDDQLVGPGWIRVITGPVQSASYPIQAAARVV